MYFMVMFTRGGEKITQEPIPASIPIPTADDPSGFIWERFDGFSFASNASHAPLPGQYSSQEDAAARVLAGGMPRSPRAQGSPIPGF